MQNHRLLAQHQLAPLLVWKTLDHHYVVGGTWYFFDGEVPLRPLNQHEFEQVDQAVKVVTFPRSRISEIFERQTFSLRMVLEMSRSLTLVGMERKEKYTILQT